MDLFDIERYNDGFKGKEFSHVYINNDDEIVISFADGSTLKYKVRLYVTNDLYIEQTLADDKTNHRRFEVT